MCFLNTLIKYIKTIFDINIMATEENASESGRALEGLIGVLEHMVGERRKHNSEYNSQSLEDTARFFAYAYKERPDLLYEGRLTVRIGLYEDTLEGVSRLVLTPLVDGMWDGNGRSYDMNKLRPFYEQGTDTIIYSVTRKGEGTLKTDFEVRQVEEIIPDGETYFITCKTSIRPEKVKKIVETELVQIH